MTRTLGLVLHHHRPEALELAKRALHWCGSKVGARMPTIDAEMIGRPELAIDESEFGSDLDACLSLGGDGTMLRSAALVAEYGVPILGVNAGHLGYLSEIDPDHMEVALERWLSGELRLEHRMMVEVFDSRGDLIGRALNEAVVDRDESGRAVDVAVSIDSKPFITFLADGLIVATPTGSTAYSLSAGGPIVEPDFRTLLLTPVAAHTVFNRPMVLSPTTEVKLKIEGYRSAVVSLDGRPVRTLEPGESVTCRTSKVSATFLVSGERDFHQVLKEKFGIADR